MALRKTKNDLPTKVREAVVKELSVALAGGIDLQMQAKQAHWNVRGPNFIGLHELFDKVAEGAEEGVDLIAERIAQLGGTANGTVQGVSQATILKPYPTNITKGEDHVDALTDAMATYGQSVREMIDRLDELGDADGADLLTEVSRQLDLHLYFVERHLG